MWVLFTNTALYTKQSWFETVTGASQPANQPASQPANQPTNQPANQPVSPSPCCQPKGRWDRSGQERTGHIGKDRKSRTALSIIPFSKKYCCFPTSQLLKSDICQNSTTAKGYRRDVKPACWTVCTHTDLVTREDIAWTLIFSPEGLSKP